MPNLQVINLGRSKQNRMADAVSNAGQQLGRGIVAAGQQQASIDARKEALQLKKDEQDKVDAYNYMNLMRNAGPEERKQIHQLFVGMGLGEKQWLKDAANFNYEPKDRYMAGQQIKDAVDEFKGEVGPQIDEFGWASRSNPDGLHPSIILQKYRSMAAQSPEYKDIVRQTFLDKFPRFGGQLNSFYGQEDAPPPETNTARPEGVAAEIAPANPPSYNARPAQPQTVKTGQIGSGSGFLPDDIASGLACDYGGDGIDQSIKSGIGRGMSRSGTNGSGRERETPVQTLSRYGLDPNRIATLYGTTPDIIPSIVQKIKQLEEGGATQLEIRDTIQQKLAR